MKTVFTYFILVSALAVTACAGGGGEAEANGHSEDNGRSVSPRAASDFIDSITQFTPEFNDVEPLVQAEWICSEFDKGSTRAEIESEMHQRLVFEYGQYAPSRGWDSFEAGVIVVDAAKYYCPEHGQAAGW